MPAEYHKLVVHMERQLGYVYKGLPVNNVKFCPEQEGTALPPASAEFKETWNEDHAGLEARRESLFLSSAAPDH